MAETQEKCNHQSKATAQVVVKDKQDSDSDSDSLQLLDRLYVYQNNQTGQVAPTARLTTRQLCRILCPPGGNDDINVNNDRTVIPETQLLAVIVETSGSSGSNNNNNNNTLTYSSEGWKPAKLIPILQQATALWYYEDNNSTASSSSSTSTVKGPVSCRKLSELFYSADPSLPSSGRIITKSTRVYSDTVIPTWSAIQDVAYLQLALQAFQQPLSSTTTAAAAAAASQEEEQPENDVLAQEEYYAAIEQQQQQQQQEQQLTTSMNNEKQIKDELEAFLTSTDQLGLSSDAVDVEDDEAYESDNGTRYIKDARTGNWVHEALIMVQRQQRIISAAAETANKDGNKNKKQSNSITKSSSLSINNSNDSNANNNNATTKKRKKSSKSQFAARNAKNWIYVTGLPSTCTEEQVQDFFSQAGIIELDPETLRPKIKLYRYKESDVVNLEDNDVVVVAGQCKGDASICFARSESVDLAITLLDEAPFQPPSFPTTVNNSNGSSSQQTAGVVRVQRAKFERHHGNNNGEQDGDGDHKVDSNSKRTTTKVISNAKRKVAKLAAIQARDWDDGEFNGRLTGGRKGLRIIVLKHVFSSSSSSSTHINDDDAVLARLEKDLLAKCQPFGTVEKITIFASNPDGVVIVKFTQPGAASEAIKALDGKVWGQDDEATAATTTSSITSRKNVVQANFWDGVTDYTVRNEVKEEEEMEKRHDQFGQWLDNQELPEELRLKTEHG